MGKSFTVQNERQMTETLTPGRRGFCVFHIILCPCRLLHTCAVDVCYLKRDLASI